MVSPLQNDKAHELRTPSQIQDQADHDAAVAAHHDEINRSINLLHLQEKYLGTKD